MEGTGVQYDETKIPFETYFGEPSIEMSRKLYLDNETPNILGFYRHRMIVYSNFKDIYAPWTKQHRTLEKEIARWQKMIETFENDVRMAESINTF